MMVPNAMTKTSRVWVFQQICKKRMEMVNNKWTLILKASMVMALVMNLEAFVELAWWMMMMFMIWLDEE